MKKSNVIVIDSYKQKKRKLRVCAYIRVSTDSDEQKHSFKNQLEYYRELITTNENWEFVDLYADEGISGRIVEKRDEFNRLIEDCRKSKIDRILVKSISRFARNTKESLEVTRELKSLGVSICFEKENIDTVRTTDEFLLTLYSQIAQEESISHSKNMKRSYKSRMEQGKFITCKAPFGYNLEDGTLYINEMEAEIIRYIFTSYINGVSKQAIADKLTKMGIKTVDNNYNWEHYDINRIIKNEKYIGDALTQKMFATDELNSKMVRNLGEKPKYYLKNSHEPIIDRETFDKAQILNELNTASVPVRQNSQLNGKIICSRCGSTFKLRVTRGVRYRVCRTHDLKASLCDIRQIRESEIEHAFVRLFNKLQFNKHELIDPAVKMFTELRSMRNVNNTDIFEINKAIADKLEQLNVLSELNVNGFIDPELYLAQTNEINLEIEKLKRDKNQGMDSGDAEETLSSRLMSILRTSPDYIEQMDAKILNSITDSIIVVSETEIRFKLINGFELTEHIERTVR